MGAPPRPPKRVLRLAATLWLIGVPVPDGARADGPVLDIPVLDAPNVERARADATDEKARAGGAPGTDRQGSAASPADPAPSTTRLPLIATLELDRATVHVNEQVLVTLEVGVPAVAFALTGDALSLDGVRLVPLSRRKVERSVAGVPYRFTRSVFALFAPRAGTVEVPPLSFRATLPVSAAPGGGHNPRIAGTTPSARVRVEPAPSSGATWLPARGIALSSRWEDVTGAATGGGGTHDGGAIEVRVGEPFTRHLDIDVRAQHPAAIPPLEPIPPEGLRGYAERPRLESRIAADGLHGTRRESHVLVAAREGPARLPPVTLDWWDIDDRRWRTASLPAERIVALPAPGGRSEPERGLVLYRTALGVLGALCALLATSTAVLWRARERPSASRRERPEADVPNEREAARALRRALREGDAAPVGEALRRWRRSRRRRAGASDGAEGAAEDRALAEALRRLDEHLYGTTPTPPPPSVRTALERALGRRRRGAPAPKVGRPDRPPLYPAGRAARARRAFDDDAGT